MDWPSTFLVNIPGHVPTGPGLAGGAGREPCVTTVFSPSSTRNVGKSLCVYFMGRFYDLPESRLTADERVVLSAAGLR